MADEKTGVVFEEAVAWLRRRLLLSSRDWNILFLGAEAAAERIVDEQLDGLAADLTGAVLEAVEDGGTLTQFQQDYERIVLEHGWSYDNKDGWHSRLIFRMQTASAYQAGRWEQAQRQVEARPETTFYLRLVTVGDRRVRHNHAAQHGIILPVGHAYWLTHYPPNGFLCRCRVQLITEREIKRNGWVVTADADPRLAIPPDDGFSGNVGIAMQASGQVLGQIVQEA